MTDKRLTDEELAELGFEEAMTRLETVVGSLEVGQLSLEESLALYEEGLRLREHCRQRLEAAEGALEKLREDAEGRLDIVEDEGELP